MIVFVHIRALDGPLADDMENTLDQKVVRESSFKYIE